jgi:integrase
MIALIKPTGLIPVRTIQSRLGHESLETTQKYLGVANLDSLADKVDAASVMGSNASEKLFEK